MEKKALPRAGIVGAGIAGLAAGIALRRAGWEVEIFEKSTFKHEVGAAITVPSNSSLVLSRWGFDFEKAGAVPNMSTRFMTENLDTIFNEQYPEIAEEFGSGCWGVHRVDLHQGLKHLAIDANQGKGVPAKIRLGSKVVNIVPETRTLSLEDGTKFEYDLVIVADGLHSHLLKCVNPNAGDLQPTGKSIYRCLLPTQLLKDDPDLWNFWSGERTGFVAWTSMKAGNSFVTYPCRNSSVMNYAIVHTTHKGEGEEDLWHSPASKEQVLKELATYHPNVRKLVAVVREDKDDLAVHHLWKREPLETFVNGCCALIGDAAHVMMPIHAAGGAVPVESAAVLEVLLSGIVAGDHAKIADRLKLWDKLRLPRCNLTMLLSNGGPRALYNPEVVQQIRRFYKDDLPAKENSMSWSGPMRELLFHYDAFSAAETALKANQS